MIRCYSDLHGMLPVIEDCDTLLIAGDICPVTGSHDPHVQNNWLGREFAIYCEFLLANSCNEIVLIPGNHDFVFELPRDMWQDKIVDGVTVLIDSSCEISDGRSVWGSPWCPNLKSWAFYADDYALHDRANLIPAGHDIWLMHSPPHGVLDTVGREPVGNRGILPAIQHRNPEFYICGHIHEQFGVKEYKNTTVMNCSFLNDFYEPMWRHIIIEDDCVFTCRGANSNPERLVYDCRDGY